MTPEQIQTMQDENNANKDIIKDLRKENGNRRTENNDLKGRLDDLEAKADKATKDKDDADLRAKGDYDTLEAKLRDEHKVSLDAANKRADTAEETAASDRETTRSEKLDNSIMAGAAGTVNPRQVLLATKDMFRFSTDEDGKTVIKNKDDSAFVDDKGKALGINDAIEAVKTANPNFVPAGEAGSGSKGGKGDGNEEKTSTDKIASGLGELGFK